MFFKSSKPIVGKTKGNFLKSSEFTDSEYFNQRMLFTARLTQDSGAVEEQRTWLIE